MKKNFVNFSRVEIVFFFSRLFFSGRERTAATRRLGVLLIDTHLDPIKPIMRLIRPGRLSLREQSGDYDRRIIDVIFSRRVTSLSSSARRAEKRKNYEAVARSFICFVADNRWNSRETDISIRRMIRLIPTSNLTCRE